MFTGITITPMYVTDQDQALEFYTEKLGFEVEADVDFGPMRWLTVYLRQDPARQVLLQRIGDTTPTAGPETADMLRELTERGGSSWMILSTDDCRTTHQQLAERGVEIVEEPTERPYGVDMAIRDPFGNQIRITERNDWTG
ncbi:VOC family protein [Nesterenkonia sp. MY13]|uniref:VOC family protein n=1 Tax=Nesterenkonia sedimenti TaxID=1463632 RepID=A0A7X8TI40_9MICC|nr:VOC family protein [Nesterenkonia sedimenti]NLS09168.1 VOC family protein [Nesterenkonia sedimenti]